MTVTVMVPRACPASEPLSCAQLRAAARHFLTEQGNEAVSGLLCQLKGTDYGRLEPVGLGLVGQGFQGVIKLSKWAQMLVRMRGVPRGVPAVPTHAAGAV